MRFKIIRLSTGLLVSTLLWGEDVENLEEFFEGEGSELVEQNVTEPNKVKKSYAASLIKNSPFIPFRASKEVLSSVESSDFEFLSVIRYITSNYSFCLKDKQSGNSFWLHSDGSDNNIYGVTFFQYDPNEKILIIQNNEGELISIEQQKPTLGAASGSGSWVKDSYAELLRELEEDDDED